MACVAILNVDRVLCIGFLLCLAMPSYFKRTDFNLPARVVLGCFILMTSRYHAFQFLVYLSVYHKIAPVLGGFLFCSRRFCPGAFLIYPSKEHFLRRPGLPVYPS